MVVQSILLPVVRVLLLEFLLEECLISDPVLALRERLDLIVQLSYLVTEVVHSVEHIIQGSLTGDFVDMSAVNKEHGLHLVSDLHQTHGLGLLGTTSTPIRLEPSWFGMGLQRQIVP